MVHRCFTTNSCCGVDAVRAQCNNSLNVGSGSRVGKKKCDEIQENSR